MPIRAVSRAMFSLLPSLAFLTFPAARLLVTCHSPRVTRHQPAERLLRTVTGFLRSRDRSILLIAVVILSEGSRLGAFAFARKDLAGNPNPPVFLLSLVTCHSSLVTSSVTFTRMPNGIAISTQNLTRRFGELTAVDNVNLAVEAGQFFGFLGPNGAGKSTMIKMLTGLLAPTSGSIRVLDLDLETHSVEVKSNIGVVPEGLALFGRLTASEYLNFVGRMYGLDRATAAQRTQELLEFMQLADRPKTLITDYSHGMQKKLAMAAAVIHGPKILFLDEPFEGVDAIAATTLKAMLQRMIARGATIFLTSHVLEIVERLCSHVAIISKGQLVAQGSLEELRAGIEARQGVTASGDGKLTLEQIFLDIVGGSRETDRELTWLG